MFLNAIKCDAKGCGSVATINDDPNWLDKGVIDGWVRVTFINPNEYSFSSDKSDKSGSGDFCSSSCARSFLISLHIDE